MAKEKKIPCISRAKMLGMIMDEYKQRIAISGTHGKTTTTSMVSVILDSSDLDPTMLIGGTVKELGSNTKVGSGDVIVTEACEYKNSFHHFKSNIAVVLNVDEDHLDFFSGIDEIKNSFKTFVDLIPKEGVLIINGDDEHCEDIISHSKVTTKTFGLNNSNYCYAKDITHDEEGHPIFDVIVDDNNLGRMKLSIPGDHNIYNALAGILATLECGMTFDSISTPLSLFKGAVRRFDIVGDYNGAKIIDDYAHHPSEIKATLKAVETLPHNEIICIFQPHTYTRTYELLNEFGTAFKNADHVIITEIYAAREKDTGLVHSKDLVEKIKLNGKDAIYLKTFEEIEDYLKKHAKKSDTNIKEYRFIFTSMLIHHI